MGAGWEGRFARGGVEGNEAVRGREGGADERLGAEGDEEGCEATGEEEPSAVKTVREWVEKMPGAGKERVGSQMKRKGRMRWATESQLKKVSLVEVADEEVGLQLAQVQRDVADSMGAIYHRKDA